MASVNFRLFKNGLMAKVRLVDSEDYLSVDENGVITIPKGVEPKGFKLQVFSPKDLNVVILQKEVGRENGGYHTAVYRGEDMGDYRVWNMARPIRVMRKGRNVWTLWHTDCPNRLDCWFVHEDGQLELFQIGVATHDDGRTFRLLGERIWEGRLYRVNDGSLVGKPHHPSWGPFLDSRRTLFDDPIFCRLLKGIRVYSWDGQEDALNPKLDPVPEGKFARVQWYIPFAGQKGQGIALLADGSTAWVHGADLRIEPDQDGVKRLRRNTLLKFKEAVVWGDKSGPPKLTAATRA